LRDRYRKPAIVLTFIALVAAMMATVSTATAAGERHQYIVEVGNSASYNAVRSEATRLGATVVRDLKQTRRLVISSTTSQRNSLASDGRVASVASDHFRTLGPPEATPTAPTGVKVRQATLGAATRGIGTTATGFTPDPAFGYAGLMWNYDRIGAPRAWNATTGSPSVTVGVSDTGLDYTHSELAPKVDSVVDFTVNENPPLGKTQFGTSDQELAKKLHAPADTDFYGHGTWIGGAIAAAADGKGINGIAPSVRLVSLKIAQWCGFAYDSTIIDSFIYAADHGIPLVNISFGGYLDFSDPSQSAIYRAYQDAVSYAKARERPSWRRPGTSTREWATQAASRPTAR
jgi:Subtilase family